MLLIAFRIKHNIQRVVVIYIFVVKILLYGKNKYLNKAISKYLTLSDTYSYEVWTV